MEQVAMQARWGSGRIDAFGDGVFAIGITLLVLDIGVPASEFGARPQARRPEATPAEVDAIPQTIGFYVVVIELAAVVPKVAACGYLAIAVVAVLRVPGDPRSGAPRHAGQAPRTTKGPRMQAFQWAILGSNQ